MDFTCYICLENFQNCNATIYHLKTVHHLKESGTQSIQCVVCKSSPCQKTYKTFDVLRKHAIKCIASKEQVFSTRIHLISFFPTILVLFIYQGDHVESTSMDDLCSSIENKINFSTQYADTRHISMKNATQKSYEIENVHDDSTVDKKSETELATERSLEFLQSLCRSINRVSTNDKITSTFFNSCKDLVDDMKKLLVSMIEDDNGMTAVHVIESATNFFQSELSQYNSTYKRNKSIAESATFVKPVECAIGTRCEMKTHQHRGKKVPQVIQNTFQYVPILETLKSIFHSTEVLECYQQYNATKHECVDGEFKYFNSGSVYRRSEFYKENPNALQIHISTDDFEICSPLQSKANMHKVCPVYFTIRNMPAKYLSKTNNMYLIAICNADDLKSRTTDFNNVWQRIVLELQHLEKLGINIAGYTIKGTLTHLSADNLGANICLGFVSSFSSSYYCRHCIGSRNECREQTEEITSQLRTKSMYNDQLKIIQDSENVNYHETKGLKYYCKLNDLQHFHILQNPTVDIMHDLHEGCIPFLMNKLFKFSFRNKIFSEPELNSSVQFHNYGWLGHYKIPSMINLKKRSMGQNATQSLFLFRHLPFILYAFREDISLKEVWPCVTSLLRIVEIVLSTELSNSDLDLLIRQVNIHLNGVKNLLHEHLRPKHHFLVHYAGIIRKMGPIAHMSMLRWEAKHQQLKKSIKGNMNFRNINKTIAMKHQKALSINSYKDDVVTGRMKLVLDDSPFLNQHFSNDNNEIFQINFLRFNNTEFIHNLLFIHDSQVFQIKNIFASKQKFFLLGQSFEVIGFNDFLNSLEIKCNETEEPKFVDIKKLSKVKTFEIKNVEGKQYIIGATVDLRKTNFWI